MKSEILSLLKSTNEYISGQELCEHFGVSRNAVWKAVESLKKDGYRIEAVRNRGYRLTDDGEDVFCQREMDAVLKGNSLIRQVRFFGEIGSTNSEAKRLAEEGEEEGILLVADRQTSGRGRRGRSWISPKGKNVYFTLMLRPDISPEKAPMLTLVMAVAVASAISELYTEDIPEEKRVSIKWPNDILIGKKKVCGILTEMSAEKDYIHYVVIGVGINVRKQDFDPEISDRAGSIDGEWGSYLGRSKLVGRVMDHFSRLYEGFLRAQDLSALREKYERFLVNKDREVLILDPQGEYSGTALGIDDMGELMVRRTDGEIVKVYAGEVSVRGIYGYV